MKRQIVITAYQQYTAAVLLEDDHAAEIVIESPASQSEMPVGSIVIGKVKNIVPNIQAAFVEIKKGILGYYPIDEASPHLFVSPKKNDKLNAGDDILVQVKRGSLKTKSLTLTSALNYTGRYVILTVNKPGLRFSSKLNDNEIKKHIEALILPQLSENMGCVVRTAAADASDEDIINELNALSVNHNSVMSTCQFRTSFSVLHEGLTPVLEMIRDYQSEHDFSVVTDAPQIYTAVSEALDITGKGLPWLRLYKDESYPLTKLKGIEEIMRRALSKKVWMKSGGYLVVEHTEAMTVIDVNTGKDLRGNDKSSHFFKINIEAAKEVIRQLRLRNISGIIAIDFINMSDEKQRKALLKELRFQAQADRNPAVVIDMTRLQLVEMTRRKTGRALYEYFYEKGKSI